MQYQHTLKTTGLLMLLLVVAMASCVPQKKMLLLKDAQMAAANLSKEYVNDRTVNYRLQPGDNLYIRAINTIDERGAAAATGEHGGALDVAT